MEIQNVHQAQDAHFSRLLERVRRGEEIVIGKDWQARGQGSLRTTTPERRGAVRHVVTAAIKFAADWSTLLPADADGRDSGGPLAIEIIDSMLLLDTCTFCCGGWMIRRALEAIATTAGSSPTRDNRVFVSAAVAWEITIKRQLGKLEAAGRSSKPHSNRIRFRHLPITVGHALAVSRSCRRFDGDPFDRIQIAQASSGCSRTIVTR